MVFWRAAYSFLSSGDRLLYKLASNTLLLPLISFPCPQSAASKPTPVILIGTGTGLAPILSFLNRRLAQLVSSCADLDTKPSVTLFAGFRSPTSQFPNIPDNAKIFLPAFDRFSKHNLFAELHITPSNDAKIRIQDSFDKFEVKEVLKSRIAKDKAWVFICGGGEMAKSVKEKLVEVLGKEAWKQIDGEGRILCEAF